MGIGGAIIRHIVISAAGPKHERPSTAPSRRRRKEVSSNRSDHDETELVRQRFDKRLKGGHVKEKAQTAEQLNVERVAQELLEATKQDLQEVDYDQTYSRAIALAKGADAKFYGKVADHIERLAGRDLRNEYLVRKVLTGGRIVSRENAIAFIRAVQRWEEKRGDPSYERNQKILGVKVSDKIVVIDRVFTIKHYVTLERGDVITVERIENDKVLVSLAHNSRYPEKSVFKIDKGLLWSKRFMVLK